jgi:uncharacterized DUF497 family protein
MAILAASGLEDRAGRLAAGLCPSRFRLEFPYIQNYVGPMDIRFDPAKDARNIASRGLSFARVVSFDWSSALLKEDARRDDGERRFQALGLIDGRLHMLVFTPRAGLIHVISLRKPNAREIRRHEEAQTQPRTD